MKAKYEVSVPVYTADDVFKTMVLMNESGCITKEYPLSAILDLFKVEWYTLQLKESVRKVTFNCNSAKSLDRFKENYHRIYPGRRISVKMERIQVEKKVIIEEKFI